MCKFGRCSVVEFVAVIISTLGFHVQCLQSTVDSQCCGLPSDRENHSFYIQYVRVSWKLSSAKERFSKSFFRGSFQLTRMVNI